MRIRARLALVGSLLALWTAVPLAAQTVFLPPRASVQGPAGFASLYASEGEGHLFFGARLTYGRGGVGVALAPGAHPGFDVRAVDRTVAVIVARYRLRKPSPRPETRDPAPEPAPTAPPRAPR